MVIFIRMLLNYEFCNNNMCCLIIFRMYYNVMLMEMDVDGVFFDFLLSIVRKGGIIIDSGIILVYLL